MRVFFLVVVMFTLAGCFAGATFQKGQKPGLIVGVNLWAPSK
jgi:hypothetical protein